MRMGDDEIKRIVREFALSWRGTIWNDLHHRLRSDMVDGAIMEHVRMAAAVEADAPFTASDLVGFRSRLIARLAAGIPRRGAPPWTFDFID